MIFPCHSKKGKGNLPHFVWSWKVH